MHRRFYPAFLIPLLFAFACTQKSEQHTERNRITFAENAEQQRIDVLIDNKLFTAYQWPDDVYKPVLHPIISSGGSTITRGFPLSPRAGERFDHRHQVGSWLNYGNVNGFDFWGNGHTGEKLPNGGEIKHSGVQEMTAGAGKASLVVSAQWLDPAGNELMAEHTQFHFLSEDSLRIIDRITTLRATSGDVNFKDTKEGMFGLRVARELELPSEDSVAVTDASGQGSIKRLNNDVSGNYRSSEGISGADVWSTRAKWMSLSGRVGNEEVAVVICDHPKNISYPTWWHARGYGLFSANPLGAKDFTKGEQQLDYTLKAGDSITFRYRIIIASGGLSDAVAHELSKQFSQTY